jgi:anion-transporting  ArsA/GET3 family ATPase
VLERRLLLVTGKGGTGKSAVAASLAIAAGRRGLRVLALAMDGGAGLARHLRADPPGPTPQRCGDVFIAAVDPGAALDQYLRLRIRVPRLAAVSRIFAAMA